MNSFTRRESAITFERELKQLELIMVKIVAHRKKFEFMLNQFRHFLSDYVETTNDDILTPEGTIAFNNMISQLNELLHLLTENQDHNWGVSAIQDPSYTVAAKLCAMSLNLKKHASVILPTAPQYFDDKSNQWLQYHLLDLRCIAASFRNYTDTANPDEPAYPLIKARLDSIDNYIHRYQHEDPSSDFHYFSPIPVNYQTWLISHNDLRKIEKIGRGITSKVFYGLDNRTGQEVAIKELKFDTLSGNALKTFQREVAVLATARHPRILALVGATDTTPFTIVTEWMANGTLYDEIHHRRKLNQTMRTIAAFDIARGMQYLHSLHIIHRDLKTLNVLLDADGFVHVSDFGFSKFLDTASLMTSNIGTVHWMAPELLSNQHYDHKVDVYAYGIMMWEILTKQIPYDGLDSAQIMNEVLYKKKRPDTKYITNCDAWKELMIECWDQEPENRPTFDEVVKRFLAGEIILDGADKEEFLQYVKDNVPADAQLTTDSKLIDLIDSINENGLSTETLDQSWEIVEKHKQDNPEQVGEAAILFLKSPLKQKAAVLLRELPCGSISKPSIMKAVELIPSGIEEYDKDILVTACKNGAADVAVIYALLREHILFALEVAAQHGVDKSLKAAVADRCVQKMNSGDPDLAIAAIRCLIGIGECKRITGPIIKQFLQAHDKALRYYGLVGAIAVSINHFSLPIEIIDMVIEMLASENEICSNVILAACKVEEQALHIIHKIAIGSITDQELILKILFASTHHRLLLVCIEETLKRIAFNNPSEEMQLAINALHAHLKEKLD